ncbi:MAG: fibronectin type III domain-containing protein, partial [Actinobacteria bacterium]|nr:fibronectin type III domain-containing protein [Actinomycetota bacterium]
TGYVVTARMHTGASKTTVMRKFTLDADTTYFDYEQVTNGLTFSFTVAAVNAIGTSAATASARVVPGTAGAPSIDNITAANGKLTVEFSAGDPGAADIRYYSYSVNGGASWVTSRRNTGSPIVISKLTNGQTYQVMVRAHNKYGAGAASEAVEATPVPDAPKAPRITRVSTTGTEITLTVKPGYNGGAEITDYEYSLDGGETWNSVGGADTQFTIADLEPLTVYSVSVRAVNEAGASDGSSPRNIKTKRG